MAAELGQAPPWLAEFARSFQSAESHGFLLHGDVDGTSLIEAGGGRQADPRQRSILHYWLLQSRLAREVVAIYSLAAGIEIVAGEELIEPDAFANGKPIRRVDEKSKPVERITRRARALELIGYEEREPAPGVAFGQLGGDLAAVIGGLGPQGEMPDPFAAAQSPGDALRVLGRLLRSSGKVVDGREIGTVAVVIDHADALVPAPAMAGKGAMSPADRLALVALATLGQDARIGKVGNPIFLICRDLAELHPDLRAADSGWKAVRVALPDRDARARYLAWFLAERDERKKPIALDGLTVAEVANLTAGLSLRNIEDVLLVAYTGGGLTRALLKEHKDAIIAQSYSEVAQMLDPLPGGFADVGGREQIKDWLRRRVIAPLREGRIEDAAKGILFVGPPGTSKAQPLHANILTPLGWKPMGDIEVGNAVIDPDGGVGTVTGVYPQGVRPTYRVTFSDGAHAECCADHLWLTQNRNARRDRGPYRARALSEIMATMASSDGHDNHTIPLIQPAELVEADDLPLDPYLLGVLLGDGHLGGDCARLTTADEEILASVRALLPEGMVCEPAPRSNRPYDYAIRRARPYASTKWPMHNPIVAIMRDLGLAGVKSPEKRVPGRYLFASIGQRLALLQGLLDTDGWVPARDTYAANFSSSSRLLADDVAFLARSLGGTARTSSYLTPSGQANVVRVKLPADLPPFRLARKADRYTPPKKYPPRRSIVSILPNGHQEVQCIAVDTSRNLYVTDDFVVTHNTYGARALAQECGFNAVALNAQNVLGGIVGESERKMARFFAFAKALAPVLVFVDEIDQSDMGKRGDQSGNPVAANLFNQMLQFMGDEANRGQVLTLFASNRPDKLDPALIRSGRIDAIIPLLLPDEAERAQIVRTQARLQGFDISDNAVEEIAAETDKYSAADLAEIVREARLVAVANEDDIIDVRWAADALADVRPSGTERADFFTLIAVRAVNRRSLLPKEYARMLDDRAGLEKEVKQASAEFAELAGAGRAEREW